MEDKTYKIVLADGTELGGLRLNGNNYISDTEVTEATFAGKLGRVIISDGEIAETHENMELVQIQKHSDGWWFILRDVPESERAARQLRADVDYLLVMEEL